MPRRSEGARLYLRGRKGRPPVWVIRDGEAEISTGCGVDERGGAEKVFQTFLAEKHRPEFSDGDPARVSIADVLTLYCTEKGPLTRRPDVIQQAVPHLIAFWGETMVAQITPGACRKYIAWRCAMKQARYKDPAKAPFVGPATASRELGVLSAAIGYAHREHKLLHRTPIVLPDRTPARDRWLTRSEVARLIWAAWRMDQGKSKHVARFILVALYTGTRHDAVLRLRWLPSLDAGWVDLEAGLIFRRGQTEAESDKRRPPVPISPRLAAHLRRWKREGGANVVQWNGEAVTRMKRAWHSARAKAGLGREVTPHILRHTFATWAIQSGAKTGLVAAALGTTERIVATVYGHHSAGPLQDIVNMVSGAKAGRRR